jgi:hypothetical protein
LRTGVELRGWKRALAIVLLALALPLVILVLLLYLAVWLAIHAAIWLWWCTRGRNVLFVYSDSPLWRDAIERDFLPRLGARAITLNWSERQRWRISLATLAFSYFGGSREFNPLGLVFQPFRRTRKFRFWKAFRALKADKPQALEILQHEFFAAAELPPPTSAAPPPST